MTTSNTSKNQKNFKIDLHWDQDIIKTNKGKRWAKKSTSRYNRRVNKNLSIFDSFNN